MLERAALSDLRREAIRIAKFGASGVLNTLVGGAAILLLQAAGIGPKFANAGGFAVGVPCGYLLNRLFVFEGARRASGGMARYLAAVALAFLANQLALSLLLGFAGGGVVRALDQVAALATYTLTLFLLCRFWVFGEPRANPPSALPGAARVEIG